MKHEQAEEFREAYNTEWTGEESARELFYVWRKLRSRCLGEKGNNIPYTSDNGVSIVEDPVSVRPTLCSSGNSIDHPSTSRDGIQETSSCYS